MCQNLNFRPSWKRWRACSSPLLLWSCSQPTEENVSHNTRAEQCARRIQEARHSVELLRDSRAAVGRAMNTVHVPLQGLQPRRPLSRQLREAEIFQQCAIPSGTNDRLDRAEPAQSKLRREAPIALGARKHLIEALRLNRAHGHALAIDRVEAAHCIPHHDQPFGEAVEPLVTTPLAPAEPVTYDI